MAIVAHLLDQKSVKAALVLVTVMLTVFLAPLAVLALSFGLSATLYGALEPLPLALVGAGSLLGLVGAHPLARYLIATLLVLGVLAVLFVLIIAGDMRRPQFWLCVVAAVVGISCLLGTLWLDDRVA